MNPLMMTKVLTEFAALNRLDHEAIEEVIDWVTNPTVRPIVDIRTFLENPYYIGAKQEDGTSVLYPKVVDELCNMNSGLYDEIVLTGGIGSAKTTCALYSTAYQLYVLSCYENPHRLFQLDPASEIVFIFQSLTAKAAKTVDYERFQSMIERSPYFQEHFRFDKDLKSEMVFPRRIVVRPVSSKDTAAIGQNVFGGLIDEVNFMAVTHKSRLAIDGGTYDQADALYNSISKRRKSRFSKSGVLPGLLCLSSSARYPGQFTDQKRAEAEQQKRRTGKTTIYIYDKTTWDVKPPEFFMPERFWVFVGTTSRKPRIITNKKDILEHEVGLVKEIPLDFMGDFERDIMGSLRDIAGVSTVAKHPFFVETEKVVAIFGKTANVLSKVRSTLGPDDQVLIESGAFVNQKCPRFAHIDLAISGDSAGLVITHVPKFVTIKRGQTGEEILPFFQVDVTIEINPPKGGEILFYRIREVVYALREKLGMPIIWVTLDSFQSTDTIQLMRQKGYTAGYQSIDKTLDPYVFLKAAVYDGRIIVPEHLKLQKELVSLEKNVIDNKIDHPPNGSKDVADALAGTVYGLTMRREVWAYHGIPIQRMPMRATSRKEGGEVAASQRSIVQQDIDRKAEDRPMGRLTKA